MRVKNHKLQILIIIQKLMCRASHTHTSQEWREAETKDCSDISIHRAVEYVVLETPYCLVDEPRDQTKLNLLLVVAEGEGRGEGRRGMRE